MDREQYRREALMQLNNVEFYQKQTEPMYKQTQPMIAKILEGLQIMGFLMEEQVEYIKGRGAEMYNLYNLYTEIKIERGLLAVQRCLQRYPNEEAR